MAYTDDAVLAKLSALNETQESIVTVAQWVMFHRRHADRTGQLWLQRLKDSGSNKRLNLIYLANEVAQQSKARRKDDFLIAFSPVIAEATATAYKGATSEVQQKLRRVVEVWRARQIFELPIQEAIESRIDELDKSRSTNKRAGGSIFSSNVSTIPNELAPIVPTQQNLSKLVLSTRTSVNAANQDYDKLTDPNATTPSAPVHAARLNGLLKTLANAEGAVAESIKARQVLIEGLEKILDINRTALAAEETQLTTLSTRKIEIDAKKREVEDNIMRGFANNSNPSTPAGVGEASPGIQQTPATPSEEPNRPQVEALTPPFPKPLAHEPAPELDLGASANESISEFNAQIPLPAPPVMQAGYGGETSYRSGSMSSGSAKKRKLNEDEFADLGEGDLDADVAEMLRQDSGTA